MGYYFDLAQKYIEFDDDRSYPSPEEQLLWRLDDLNDKHEELIAADAPYRGWSRLTDDDIRFAVPEYFNKIADVERAIELAIQDLKDNYEIDVLEVSNNEAIELDEVSEEQISFFDILKTPHDNSIDVEASQKCDALLCLQQGQGNVKKPDKKTTASISFMITCSRFFIIAVLCYFMLFCLMRRLFY